MAEQRIPEVTPVSVIDDCERNWQWLTRRLKEMQDQLDDHEKRLTTLEP